MFPSSMNIGTQNQFTALPLNLSAGPAGGSAGNSSLGMSMPGLLPMSGSGGSGSPSGFGGGFQSTGNPMLDMSNMMSMMMMQFASIFQTFNQMMGGGAGGQDPNGIMSGDVLNTFNQTQNSLGNASSIFKDAQSYLQSQPPGGSGGGSGGGVGGGGSTGGTSGGGSTGGTSGGGGATSGSPASGPSTGSGDQSGLNGWLESQVGTGGGEAVNKYSKGKKQAWCADFVSTALAQNGGSPFGHISAVQGIMDWGKKNNRWIPKGQKPQVGDVMIQKSGGASHTGIVTKVNPDGSYETIEGNSGNKVAKRKYPPTDGKLTGFVRPRGPMGGGAMAA